MGIKFTLSEEDARLYETIFKCLGILGAVVAFFLGIYEFRITKEREYEKDIFLEKIKVMNEVVDVTSTLASYPDSDQKFKSAALDLDKLRAGKLYLFSDSILNDKMGNFFADFHSFIAKPPGVDKNDLEKLSTDISLYCTKKIEALTRLTYVQ